MTRIQVVGIFSALAPMPANAHSPMPGVEGFYIGLLDPLSSGPQLCLLVGLGLLVGGFDNRVMVWPLCAFLLGTLVGIVFGAGLPDLNAILLATAVLSGAVATTLPGRFLPLTVVVAVTAGVLIGAVSIPDPGPLRDRIITVSGSFVGANIALLYIAGGILLLRERYAGARISALFRSAAGLVCAIAVILLVFQLGPGSEVRSEEANPKDRSRDRSVWPAGLPERAIERYRGSAARWNWWEDDQNSLIERARVPAEPTSSRHRVCGSVQTCANPLWNNITRHGSAPDRYA